MFEINGEGKSRSTWIITFIWTVVSKVVHICWLQHVLHHCLYFVWYILLHN